MESFTLIAAVLLCSLSWISASVSQTVEVQPGEEVTLLCLNISIYPTQSDWFRVLNGTKPSCVSSIYGAVEPDEMTYLMSLILGCLAFLLTIVVIVLAVKIRKLQRDANEESQPKRPQNDVVVTVQTQGGGRERDTRVTDAASGSVPLPSGQLPVEGEGEPGPSSKAANEESRGEEAEVPVQEEVEDHESSTDEEEAAMDSQCQGQSEAPTQDATDTEPPVVVSEARHRPVIWDSGPQQQAQPRLMTATQDPRLRTTATGTATTHDRDSGSTTQDHSNRHSHDS
ncbi:hypothetical protein JOQ06_020581 [Pogonophryne albipinna]|uniref:Ig-like domain-containing protein n=1 Tax=Pogonophryne albipinna TaxID=1090488 RepID=A0AAD6BTS4_9TELE|nr:hypothetical protein JOQ06_020581 [Pogonophryne albipinna]